MMVKESPTLLTINWQDIRHPQAGGAEVHTHQVSSRLVAQGVRCIQYSCHFPNAPVREIIDGVEIRRVGSRGLFNFYVYFLVRRWVKELHPTWVIEDSNKIPFFLPWIIPQEKILIRIQHLFGRAIFHETQFLSGCYVYLTEKLGLCCWRKRPIITFSESSQKDLISFGMSRVFLAHHGIDHQVYQSSGLPKVKGQIGYMGRVKKYKGLDVVIRAFAKLNSTHSHTKLVIGGGGDDLPRLQKLVDHLGLQKSVKFLGRISESEKINLYTQSEIMVNSSRKEGWGLTTIEANCCGTVVVASDVPGLCDSVVHGLNGYLVPFGNVEMLCTTLQQLLDQNELRTKMEKQGFERARTFTWEKTAEITYQTLKTL